MSRLILPLTLTLTALLSACGQNGVQNDDELNGVRTISAQAVLGGLNLNGYCNARWTTRSQIGSAAFVANNAYGWRCKIDILVYPATGYQSISMTDACRWQYGSNAMDAYRNYNDPYSWYCYR